MGTGTKVIAVNKDSEEMALISHTGGTTGEPKGVMCSDAGLNSLMWQLLCNFEFSRQEICLAVLPPFVNYSLVESMMAMLAVGFQVVLIPDYKPEKFVEYICRYRPNEILSIPPYWEALLNIADVGKADLSCLKHLYYGGESMSADNEAAINRILAAGGSKTELCKGIGATEMGAGATISFPGCNPPNSVGIPMIQTNCKIVEVGGEKELSYNELGEICFAGPTLMLGYYNKQEETEKVVRIHRDGQRWLHTGDIGFINEEGIVFVTGRMKRIIMIKGRDGMVTKMFPDRIEKAMYKHPLVEQCCVIGIPDKERINYPKAFVVLKEDNHSLEITEEIKEVCRKRLPEYMVPEQIVIEKELPRTARGKVDYRELEKRSIV